MKSGRKRTGVLLLSVILVLSLFAGCSAASDTYTYAEAAPAAAPAAPEFYTETAVDAEMSAEMDVEPVDDEAFYEAAPPTGGGLGGAGLVVQQSDANRKFVITVDLGLQTKTFDAGVETMKTLTEQVGGYIQDSYAQGSGIDDQYVSRTASYTVRIPIERLNEFLEAVSGSFNVTHQQQSSTDITTNYYDTEARLKSLRVQEERLMAMLQQSGGLDDLLRIEREHAEVLYEIEQMTSSLNRMDDSVNLATVTMQLYEVVEYKELEPEPATFGERVGKTLRDSWNAFQDFCENVLLGLIALIPFLPVLLVIAAVVILLVRRGRKRRAERRQSYPPAYPMPQPPRPVPPAPEDNDPDKE